MRYDERRERGEACVTSPWHKCVDIRQPWQRARSRAQGRLLPSLLTCSPYGQSASCVALLRTIQTRDSLVIANWYSFGNVVRQKYDNYASYDTTLIETLCKYIMYVICLSFEHYHKLFFFTYKYHIYTSNIRYFSGIRECRIKITYYTEKRKVTDAFRCVSIRYIRATQIITANRKQMISRQDTEPWISG